MPEVAHDLCEKPPRDLEADAGAVAGLRVSIEGATVGEVGDALDRHLENGMAGPPEDVRDEAAATGVPFLIGPI